MRIKRRALDIRSERGFTIIEVIIAITIFGLVMTLATVGLGTALSLTRNNRSRSVAANLASQENDIVRTTLFSALPLGQTITTQLVDTTTYTITRNSEWVSTTATTSECLAGVAATVAYLRVSIAVTWPNMKGTAPVTSQSLVTPPIGTYSTNSGNVGVTVRDRSAAPQESIPVTLTGPGVSVTQFTGTDGCAFFPFQPAGVYTVSLLLFGFVNGQELANPSQTVTIVTGSTVTASFDFDQASTLVLTLTGAAGGVPPNLLKASLGNTGLVPSGFVSVPGAVGVVRTVTGLYPYSSGYKPWAGDCLDADPEAVKADGTGPYYPGATRDAPLNSSPGGTTAGILTLSTVRVQVNAFAGPAIVGATVTAVHGNDNRCPIGETFTLPGVTDATGSLTSALPFGTWTFQVTGRLPKTVWPAKTLAPPAPGVATVVAVVVQ